MLMLMTDEMTVMNGWPIQPPLPRKQRNFTDQRLPVTVKCRHYMSFDEKLAPPVSSTYIATSCLRPRPLLNHYLVISSPTHSAMTKTLADGRQVDRIQNYSAFWQEAGKDGKVDTSNRLDNYQNVVNGYYDGATSLYEWGWGSCFHFCRFYKGEGFYQAVSHWFLLGVVLTRYSVGQA